MKRIILNSVISIFLVVACSTLVQAQSDEFILRVDGLACPFCAYGLEKKVMKIEGVRSYDVGMKKGEVYIGLNDDADIDIAMLKKAVKEAGFTLRSISLKKDGKIEEVNISRGK